MKKWSLSVAMSLVVFGGLRPGVTRSEPTPGARDIGAEVRAVFAAKCASCHGPDLAKPKGRFGYVLDLPRIAGNPELVIPQRPSESEIWSLVQHDEMPPTDSPHGPLTLTEKEVIRAWIAAGAPDIMPSVASVVPEPTAPGPVEMTRGERFVRWFGKFHLLLLHFPIAFVLAAGGVEVWSIWRRKTLPVEVSRFYLWPGAIAAVLTVGLGWLYAAGGHGATAPQLLAAHRWLGTAAAGVLILAAVCAERDGWRVVRNRWTRPLILAGVLLVALAAHFGGLLTQGADFFDY